MYPWKSISATAKPLCRRAVLLNQSDVELQLFARTEPIKRCCAASGAGGAPPIQWEPSFGTMACDAAALGSPVHVRWREAKAESPREQGKQLLSLPPSQFLTPSFLSLWSWAMTFSPSWCCLSPRETDREINREKGERYKLWTGWREVRPRNHCVTISVSRNYAETNVSRERFCQIPRALEAENKSHDKSATNHRHWADLLSDSNIQLDPNQPLPSYMSASLSPCSRFPFNSIKS